MFSTMKKMERELIPPKEKKKRRKTQKEIFELPKKYTKGLSEEDVKKKTENVKKTKELLKKGKKKEAVKLARERPTTEDKTKSSNLIKFKKMFGDDVKPLTQKFATVTGVPLSIQKQIIKRGEGAYLSSSSRSSVSSARQWGLGRVYAFYIKGISGKLDFDKDLFKKVKLKK